MKLTKEQWAELYNCAGRALASGEEHPMPGPDWYEDLTWAEQGEIIREAFWIAMRASERPAISREDAALWLAYQRDVYPRNGQERTAIDRIRAALAEHGGYEDGEHPSCDPRTPYVDAARDVQQINVTLSKAAERAEERAKLAERLVRQLQIENAALAAEVARRPPISPSMAAAAFQASEGYTRVTDILRKHADGRPDTLGVEG